MIPRFSFLKSRNCLIVVGVSEGVRMFRLGRSSKGKPEDRVTFHRPSFIRGEASALGA